MGASSARIGLASAQRKMAAAKADSLLFMKLILRSAFDDEVGLVLGDFDLEIAIEELLEDVIPGEGTGMGHLHAKCAIGLFNDAHVADDAIQFLLDAGGRVGNGV